MNWLVLAACAAFAVFCAMPDKKEEEHSEVDDLANPTPTGENKPVSKKRGRPKKVKQELPPAREENPPEEQK